MRALAWPTNFACRHRESNDSKDIKVFKAIKALKLSGKINNFQLSIFNFQFSIVSLWVKWIIMQQLTYYER